MSRMTSSVASRMALYKLLLLLLYVQDKVNQEDSEQNEVDGMKKGSDSTGKVMHM